MDDRRLIVRPWEVITCPNNHPCYLVVRELRVGDNAPTSIFIPLGHHVVFSRATTCPQCGHDVIPNHRSIYVRGELRGFDGKYADED